VIVEKLVELFDLVWSDRCVVRDWCNALIVSLIPKKGNLKLCDNWRGISLLDIVRKILGRIVHQIGYRECTLNVESELVGDVQI